MNIIEAVKLAVHGNKIRRSCWFENQYIIFKMYDEKLFAITVNEEELDTVEEYKPHLQSILAQDWELYNDPIIEDEEEEEEII